MSPPRRSKNGVVGPTRVHVAAEKKNETTLRKNMSLESLRRHLSALKLELLEEGGDASDELNPIVRGSVETPSKIRSAASGTIFRSPIAAATVGSGESLQLEGDSDELASLRRRLREANSELAMLRQTTKSAPYLVAHAEALAEGRAAALASLQQQVEQSNQYYDKLFRTLGQEFVMAVKHIGALEVRSCELARRSIRMFSRAPISRSLTRVRARFNQSVLHFHPALISAT